MGPVPRLHQYYEDATTSYRPSRRTSFPSLGGTSVALVITLLNERVHRRGLELVTRLLHPGIAEETGRSSQVLGKPLFVCTCSNPTPAGLLAPDHYGAAAWPLVIERQRLPRKGFRRSIAWLSNSLSTLRRVRYLTTTQDSLPVAGQALLDGTYTRKVPLKSFRVVIYISFPFPKLAWRNRCNRLQFETGETAGGSGSSASKTGCPSHGGL